MCKIQFEFNTEAEREAYLNGYELAKKMFKKPNGKWIPCYEKLPERNELVLVSFKTGEVLFCEYLDDGSNNPWYSFKDGCCAYSNFVNAWMPLPEPYKEEGDTE